jgi:hypothetical protein
MARLKTPYHGDQLPLPLEQPQPDIITSISPTTVRFLLLHLGKDVPWMGVAIAQNSRYLRVRYVEAGQMREGDVPRHRLLSLQKMAVMNPLSRSPTVYTQVDCKLVAVK